MKKNINGKEYEIKELTYLEALEVEESRAKGIKTAAKQFLIFSTGLSEEEIDKLSMKEGVELQKAANEVNDLDFQEPAGN